MWLVMNVEKSKYLSSKMLALLEKSGKTRVAMARFAGISSGHIADHLSGKAYPKLETLIKYSEFLKVSLYELTGIEALKNIEVECKKVHPTEEDLRLLNAYKALPEDDPRRKAIDALLLGGGRH